MSKEKLPEEVTSSISSMETALENIEAQLQPLLEFDLEGNQESLSAVENARLRVVLGYAINALYYSK